MSEVYLAESEESNLDLSEQAVFKPNGLLKTTSMHEQCLESIGVMLPFTTTLPNSILQNYHMLICLREVSHAKTLAMQVKELESKKVLGVGFGKNTSEPFARFDRGSYSWKTYQHSLTGGLILFSETWPRSGTMQNGIASQLPVLVPLTDGIESSSWATPNTLDSMPPKSQKALMKEATVTRPGRLKPANLRDQVSNMHMWPTPKEQDSRAAHWDRGKSNLGEVIQGMHRTKGDNGQLNPTWVEWLMGFPLGWTELNVSETQSYRKSRSSLHKSSKKNKTKRRTDINGFF